MRTWDEFRPGDRPWVVAHRGDSGHHPENTMAAFEAAIGAHADAIELDVQLSADDVPVVIHDATLDRTTDGHGPVAAHAWSELRDLNAGRWFHPDAAGEPIPRLDAVLARYADRIPLDLELKAEATADDARRRRLVAEVVRLTRGLEHRILISSFDAALLEHARHLAPTLPRMLLAEGVDALAVLEERAKALRAIGVGIDRAGTTAACVAALQVAGLPVFVFTVDEQAAMRALLDAGVDGLFTNHVARLRALVGEPA